jgi:hypothetical protein
MARLYQQTTPTVSTTGRLYQPEESTQPTGRLYTTETKANLTTLEGLQQLAKESGLEMPVKKIIEKKGEEPKKIYSGGFVSDIFDTLNALQYGVTGVIKGKGFVEGVKTRQSFSDKDALGDKGIPGMIGGIALDIAVDPLTYVPVFGWGKAALKGIKGLTKVAGKAVTKAPIVGKTSEKVGDLLGRSFIYRFGQDPLYKEIAERSIKNIAVGNQNLLEIARSLTKLDNATQKVIAEARKAGSLEKLPTEILAKAKPAFDELDRLGKKAVDVGLLKKETYDANVGKYIARLYKTKEIPEGIIGKVKAIFDRKPLRIDLSRFKKRTDIPEDVRKAMGEILEAGYPTAKGLVQLNQAVERATFFSKVAKTWGKDALEDGFSKLPDTKTLGKLAGKVVPKPIFDDIQEIIRPREGITRKIVAGFKFGKVIMNPATHSRNIMSNFLLNNFEGLSPARLDIYGTAARQLVTKGKWYQEAQKVGLGLNTFASREIKDILIGPEAKGLKGVVKKVMDKIGDLYQGEEEFAKMAQYIFQRKKGLSIDDAWKVAERATFNYSQVTPFIRRMRESIFGYPFITFTYKATPQIAKTLITKPTKISNLGKIKQAIESLSEEKALKEERAVEPDYIKNGLYIRLPGKDKYGRGRYFDLTYIMPFGDIFTGQFIQREKPGETFVQSLEGKLPLLNTVKELSENKDFFGNKIIKATSVEPQQAGADLMKYLVKFYGPPIATDFPFRLASSFEFEKTAKEQPLEAEKRTTRTVGQEIRRGLFGLKVLPFNLERERMKREYELRDRITELLIDAGVVKKFERAFIPKD